MNIKCPQCQHEFAVGPVVDWGNDSRFAMSLTPGPNSKMELRSVSESLTAMAKLYATVGKDMGAKVTLLIERIATKEDGTLEFHFLASRLKCKTSP